MSSSFPSIITASPRGFISPDGPLTRTVRMDVSRVLRTGHDFRRGDLNSRFLTDWMDGKYPMKGLDRLVWLHVMASNVDAAYALPDHLALFIARQRLNGALDFDTASEMETRAVAAADPVQHEVRRTRCPHSMRVLVELLAQQKRATDLFMAACYAELAR